MAGVGIGQKVKLIGRVAGQVSEAKDCRTRSYTRVLYHEES